MNEGVERALAELRPGMEADGFDLSLEKIDGGVATVVLEAREDACLDCLLPDEVLVAILENSFKEQEAGILKVVLEKKNF